MCIALKARSPEDALKSIELEITNLHKEMVRDGYRYCHRFQAAQQLRKIIATHEEVAELIQVGLYQKGTSPEVDQAMEKLPEIKRYLAQQIGEFSSFQQTSEALQSL